MKKLIVCVVCLLLVLLSMAACGGKNGETPAPTTNDGNASYTADGTVIPGSDPKTWGPADDGETVQIPNPWTDCTNLEEAGKLAGFSFIAPDALEGYPEKYIGAIENEIAEVIFNDEDGAEICFRKGVGTEDISGDYNDYAVIETQTVDGAGNPVYQTPTGTTADTIILEGSDVEDYESLQYFQRQLGDSGILDELVKRGVQENDTIRIGDFEFDYVF